MLSRHLVIYTSEIWLHELLRYFYIQMVNFVTPHRRFSTYDVLFLSFGVHILRNSLQSHYCRLTFWLSNCVVLRAILCEAFAEDQLPVSASSLVERNGAGKRNQKISELKWKVSFSDKQAYRSAVDGSFEDLEDSHAFMSALEKVESWIFSRIVESVWWQVLCIFHFLSVLLILLLLFLERGDQF